MSIITNYMHEVSNFINNKVYFKSLYYFKWLLKRTDTYFALISQLKGIKSKNKFSQKVLW